MEGKNLALCLLLAVGAVAQDQAPQLPPPPPPAKRAALEAEISNVSISGRVRAQFTATVKITNTGPDYVYFVLFGWPSVIDDAGSNFPDVKDVTGAAYCPGPQTNPPSHRLCVGVPRVDDRYFFPFQGYTELAPGAVATINYVLYGGGLKGTKYSLTHELAFRILKQPGDDDNWTDDQKRKRLRLVSLTFKDVEPKGVATSTITYAPIK